MVVLKNIIFSGGAFKGWAHIGAIRALNETIDFKQIQQVVGVSIGSVFALFYLLRIDHNIILNYFLNMDIKKYFDIDLDSVIINESLLQGNTFREIILSICQLKESTTFLELYQLTGKLFTTCAFNVSKVRLEYFNRDLTPQIKVIDAIMASSALPVLFPAYSINGDYYYDGGICNNCPCNLVDKTTSIALTVTNGYRETNYRLLNLISSLTTLLNRLFVEDKSIIYNIVDEKYDNETYNINQSRDTIFNLYFNGYKNTQKIVLLFLEKV
jgi:NTE family protein